MGFIYSDLMVPPLVEINAQYYGWKVALYIAAVMYVSIVCTALILHYALAFSGLIPESAKAVKDVAKFQIDYTFWMNIAAVALAGWLAWLNHAWHRRNEAEEMDMGGDGPVKKTLSWTAVAVLGVGIGVHLFLTVG